MNELLISAQQKYQQAKMQTASPSQLLLMLYDGAIRFVKAGIEGIEEHNIEKANTFFNKSQAIIHELIASLDYKYELSTGLHQIYEYMLHQLIQANVHKDEKAASEVLAHLREMRDAWEQAVRSQSRRAEYA